MASNKRTLEVVIAGDAKGAMKAFGDMGKSADGFGGKMATAGKAAAAGFAVIGAGALGAGAALFKLGSDFDSAFDNIVVGTGATGMALEGLKDDFRAVVSEVPTDFASASTAIADLNTRLGLTGPELQGLSAQMLEMSRLTGTDLAGNIESVTRAFGDFGIDAEFEGAGALDLLFRASQQTGIGVDELAAKMTQAGAPLRTLGFNFAESAALLGKFEKEGVNTEAILAGMRSGLGRMVQPGEQVQDTFARIMGQMRGAQTDTEAMSIAIDAFGSRAGPDLALAVREGRFEFDKLLSSIQTGESTILGTAEQTSSFSQEWTKIKNRVFVAIEPLATKLFQAIGDGMTRLAPLVERGAALLSEFAAIFETEGFSGVASRLGQMIDEAWPVVRAKLGDLASGLLDWVADTAPKVGRQLLAWGAEFVEWILPQIPPALRNLGRLLSDVGQWILDEGLPLLVRKLREWGGAFVDWIGPQIGPLLLELGKMQLEVGQWIITEGLPALIEKLVEWAVAFAGWVKDPGIPMLLDGLRSLGDALGTWITDTAAPFIVEKVKVLVPAALQWIGDALIDLPGQLLRLFQRVGTWIVADGIPMLIEKQAQLRDTILRWAGDAAAQVPTVLGNLFSAVADWLRDDAPGLIATAAEGLWDGIVDAFKAVFRTLIDLWNSFDLTFTIPDIPGVPKRGESFDIIPDVPNPFHTGGVATEDTFAFLRRGEQVLTPAERAGGGGSAPMVVNIHNEIHATQMDPDALAEALERRQETQLSRLAQGDVEVA